MDESQSLHLVNVDFLQWSRVMYLLLAKLYICQGCVCMNQVVLVLNALMILIYMLSIWPNVCIAVGHMDHNHLNGLCKFVEYSNILNIVVVNKWNIFKVKK